MKVKNADTSSPNTWTWLKTMLCIGQVLSEARSMMNLIKSYGKLDVVYSFPSSAIPPDVGKKETGRASVKAPSPTPSAATRSLTTTVRTPGSYIPTQHGLAVRASMEVPLVQVFRACHSCGSKTHLLGECPVLYYSDSNTDHQAEWEGSTVGMAWAAVGFTEWQQKLVPSGYEDRVQYFLRGTKPYMMDNDTKRAKNSHGSSNNPSSSDDSDRSNQGQGGYNQNQGNEGNQGGGRDKQRGGYNPNENQNQGRGSDGRGNRYNPPQENFPPPLSSSGQDQGKNLRFDDVAAVFDNDTHNLMDVHIEEQPHVIVREEFLHDPSVL